VRTPEEARADADYRHMAPRIHAGAPQVRFQRPELPSLAEIAPYYARSEAAGWFSNGGPCAANLAQRLGDALGTMVVPVSSATTGIIVALRAICGEPTARRRLVAVPSFTFTASAGAIVWAGYEPLFVDVLPDSWQIDPQALRAALDEHPGEVAGVMGCSTFGTPPPSAVRDGWRAACAQAGVPLLLDSAAAYGATDDAGRLAGSLGETEVFSFHATKPFAIGEGGAVSTPDLDVAERITRLINFGMEPGGRSSTELGINGKLSEIHAATGLAMLDRYDDVIRRRRDSARRLRSALLAVGAPVSFQSGVEGSTVQVGQLATATAVDRFAALDAARRHGVEARCYFDPPLHLQPAFARWAPRGGLPVTEQLAARSLSLPMYNDLSDDRIARIAGIFETVELARAA
jgi:dTDP-4-amino-4,6-dideoxygalactose transaminase